MTMAFDAKTICRRQSQLETFRSNFDSHWQEVQDYVLPQSVGFTGNDSPGVKKMDRVFDSTPITANEHFAAAMQSMLTPATEQWHKLVAVDPELEDDYEVNDWLDEATEVLFHARYSPRAKFGQAIGEAFLSFGAFGNSVVLVEDKRGEHLVYRTGHPREFYFVEDEWGSIDTMHRKFQMSAQNMASEFGEDMLPEQVRIEVARAPDTLFDVLHVVTPRHKAGYQGREGAGMAYASCYVSTTGEKELRRSGYRSFPYAVARYMTTAGETYGRGPGMTALPDIKTLNEMMKTILRAAQKVVDPPLVLASDGALGSFQQRTGALNRGYMTMDGKPLAAPLVSGARVDIGIEMLQDVRTRVSSVFKVDLFRILVDKPHQITATEAMIRAQEKGALLAPPGQRAQGEFLGAMITRELDILMTAGQLPPMPDALLMRGGPAAVKVEYSAPINQAQKAQKGVAIQTFLANIGALVEIDPGVLDSIDTDEVVKELRDVAGAPQKIVRTAEQIKARRDQKAQERDAQLALAAAEQSGKAAESWSKAGATAAQVPSNTSALLQ